MQRSSGRHALCKHSEFCNVCVRAFFEAVSRLDAETILGIAVAAIMMQRRGHASTAKNMRNLTIGTSQDVLERGRKRGGVAEG